MGLRKEETVDTHEGASTRRGIAEALGWDSMVQGHQGKTGADRSPGGTNFGGLEGRRSEEEAKENKTGVTPQTHSVVTTVT